ncbi:sulfatase [Flagellimonas pacifica]|uniref:Arylsulfatase A n=1 Tax=Flagellimonas pacifica TaxID=1247520 RepID=A0A285N077_9FLAO|nr:sulfatase [Allomuricauda parva]SNZ01161.1 arylsulfatase A [Allomuricauda parva]
MKTKQTIYSLLLFFVLLLCFGCNGKATSNKKENDQNPNVIIIYVDDMGYGDLSSFGNPTVYTPHLDKMAAEGMKLSQFYVAAPVCSPSRAALLTGAYPKRVGLEKGVLFPQSVTGLNPEEQTIAEVLKGKKYSTACIGKWHLGHQEKFLPHNQGFDEFFGIPFSNDMSKKEQEYMGRNDYKWQLPLLSQSDTLELDPDQTTLTKRLTERAMTFIKKNSEKPFFLYLAHPMPHIPIYASPKFQNTSVRGPYGDTIEEIDWSVGQILETLKTTGIDENTFVIFTSDNGPWKVFKTEGGSAGPLRGAKGTTWEGGQRVPCIVRWPGKVPAGYVQRQVITNMDLLPTVANLCGAQLPKRKIDGRDVSKALLGADRKLESSPFLYYASNGKLEGIRDGKYKLLVLDEGTFLFDLESDISEEYNLFEKHSEKVNALREKMKKLDSIITLERRTVGSL